MSETIPGNTVSTSMDAEKPVSTTPSIQFPPFSDPKDEDFEDDLPQIERNYYKSRFSDLNVLKTMRLHCTACDRHMGLAANNVSRLRTHPLLRTLVCRTCHSFYNSGEFEKGDDGSELYCRWCGQGGQVYCCSNCPHVFCAKCIKRNFGLPKIREIENTDDWKCFVCDSKFLWDLRARCWALLRYCDLKNKMTFDTEDPELKEAYQKEITVDRSECCKSKARRSVKKEKEEVKKKEVDEKKEKELKKTANTIANVMTKLPPTIQVRKFASINLDESSKDKKPPKRPGSPLNKPHLVLMPNPVAQSVGQSRTYPKIIPMPVGVGATGPKKMKMPPQPPVLFSPIRIQKDKVQTYTRIRPKLLAPVSTAPPHLLLNNQLNGFNAHGMFNNNMAFGDNINLSLESLTQGLDMATVAAISQQQQQETSQDDVVCTPDFPMEPLFEVNEDFADDDVQCITPNPPQKVNTPPPLVPRLPNLADVSSDNIIQMTENDVTVNAATGGLKFRVDPQTLSSNKMYRLPDGRIFAINANPNMPGGYSATIVAVTEANSAKTTPKGATYAAKLSAVTSAQQKINSPVTRSRQRIEQAKKKTTKKVKPKIVPDNSILTRKCDLNVPIEWYRFNVIDATDSLEYSLSKLQKLKKDTTSQYLRTRTIDEMRTLHRTLDRLLNTSIVRFTEIRENVQKELNNYIAKKTNRPNISDDDDDDVEILNELQVDDDPIFIDENSIESNTATGVNETQEVDLTEVESEHNDSAEKSTLDDSTLEKETHLQPVQMEPHDDTSSTTYDDKATLTALNEIGNEKKDNGDEKKDNGDENKDNGDENKDNGDENRDNGDENKDNGDETKDTSIESIANKDNIPNNEKSDGSIACDTSKLNGDSVDKNNATEDNIKDSTDNSKLDSEPREGGHVESVTDKNKQDSNKDIKEETIKANEREDNNSKIENMDTREDKTQDAEMSDEMLESLLNVETSVMDEIDAQSLNCLERLQDS